MPATKHKKLPKLINVFPGSLFENTNVHFFVNFQVAEWMGGGRQAWSAAGGRSADSRTKPTHWKFAGRGDDDKKLGGYDNQVSLEDEEPPPERRKPTVKTRHEKKVMLREHNERQTKAHQYMTKSHHFEDVDYEDQPEYHKIEQPIDDDSMQRHEMERGSDIGYAGNAKGDKGTRELFIKEGNAEILRLITRGKNEEENIYVNLPGRTNANDPQYIKTGEGGGKEILMRRYIEEQANGKQIIREHYQIIPNQNFLQAGAAGSHAGSNIYQDPQAIEEEKKKSEEERRFAKELEESLKNQNELLRQILLEKEKLEEKIEEQENALETQSLPCNPAIATQTDCEATTQTDPINITVEKRLSKSENDDSMSEDDYEYVKYTPPDTPEGVCWIKRKRHRVKRYKNADRKHMSEMESVKRKIRTPILEETEDTQVVTKDSKNGKSRRKSPSKTKDTPQKESSSDAKKNALKLMKVKNDKLVKTDRLEKKLLTEISDSIEDRKLVPKASDSNNETRKHAPRIYKKNVRYYGDSEGSEKEVVIKRNYYSADSLDDDDDDDEPRPTSRSASPVPKQRTSVRTGQRQIELVPDEKYRRPEPGGRPPKRQAPRPPFDTSPKARSRFYTSESNLVRRMREEGIHDVPHGVSRYMDWYYSKNKDKDIAKKIQEEKEEQKKLKGGRLRIKAAIRNGGVFNLKRISPARLSRSEESLNNFKPDPAPRTSPPKRPPMMKEDIEQAKKLQSRVSNTSSHPLLQHSEHRFEHEYEKSTANPPTTKLPHYMYPETPPTLNQDVTVQHSTCKSTKPKISPIKENEVKNSKSQVPLEQLNVSNLEDDHDSGIAMNSLLHSLSRGQTRNPIADKKSVFTIAYDGVRVEHIPSTDNGSPPFKK